MRHDAEFLVAAAQPDQFPPESLPEVALAGRSNVGKSSLLNRLLRRDGLARVSARPGRTQTLNFYRVDKRLVVVDLPGYGYSEAPKSVSKPWRAVIEAYLQRRRTLQQCLLLLDARRGWMPSDLTLKEWLESRGKRYFVVATKVDRLTQKERSRNLAEIRCGCPEIPVVAFSAVTGEGEKEVWQRIWEFPKRQVTQ